MSHDQYGRPLVRIEPARWMWRGQEIRVEPWDDLRQAQGLAARDQGNVRIGDIERDAAVSALGDHYAAGRLTREEFDERSEQAMQARFHGDLAPLFADLPRAPQADAVQGPRPRGPYPMFLPLFWLAPLLLLVGVVAAVVLSAPWVIWTLFWVFLFSGFWGRRRFQHRRWPTPPSQVTRY